MPLCERKGKLYKYAPNEAIYKYAKYCTGEKTNSFTNTAVLHA